LGRGWCSKHYSRWRATGDPLGIKQREPGAGTYSYNEGGYLRFRGPGGKYRFVHRMVMEETLDRPLYPFENVHHRNGIRDDNRPENLELWIKPQPQGQRPEDLVAWVVEFYPTEVAEALKSRER
jgi:hypothetical protein